MTGRQGTVTLENLLEALLQLLGHLTPGELLADPRSTPSNAYLVLAGFFALLIAGGTVASRWAERWSRGNRIHRRLFDLYGQWAAWLGLAGLIAVGLRYTNVSLLSKRIWTVLDFAAIVGVAIHLLLYRLRKYPKEIAEYREVERKRRYLPSSRRRR